MRYKVGTVTYDSLARAIDALVRDCGLSDPQALTAIDLARLNLPDSNGVYVVSTELLGTQGQRE